MYEQEKNIYKKMKGKTFIHTPRFDFEHLRETGVDVELDLIFAIVGSKIFLEHYWARIETFNYLISLHPTNYWIRGNI